MAAAVEAGSEHPIAAAINSYVVGTVGAVAAAASRSIQAGVGATGVVDGVVVRVGRGDAGPLAPAKAQAEATGRTVVTVSRDEQCVGLVVLADTVKPTSAAGLASLRSLGRHPILLTGGNDSAALAQADLGIAMGTGTDVAIEAGDLTLMRPDLAAAADAIRLSRRALAVIKGNLVWAFAYNVAAIPLAMSWLLSPVVASAAMASSSVFVVSNSLRLRRFTLTV